MQDPLSAARASPARFIAVSPEMTAVLGSAPGAPVPPRAMALIASTGKAVCSLHFEPRPRLKALLEQAGPHRLVFLVQREAVLRLGGRRLIDEGAACFHLSAELRGILLSLRHPPATAEARSTYQLAKSIEFLCETLRLFAANELAPLVGEGLLSPADTRRVMAARQMIDDRASEKLTLDLIARGCGLNRSKLTRGFRELFNCTVAEAIAERRLDLARRMLLTTDLPVSSIGYESGYLNNASFARAFGRRFGRSPSDFRLQGLAA
jgi:AraC family transcriptional activator of pyochelin receptor